MTKYTIADFYIDETNSDFGPVVRWTSNDNIPFADMLAEFAIAGYIDQQIVINSINARKIEDEAFLQQYVEHRQKNGYSNEEKFEMRAVFGNEEVVDIFTGKTIKF